MFNTHILTKEEQHLRNLEERAAWEKNVNAIFTGFMAVFILLTVVESAVGLWLFHFLTV